jgi:Plasma-membrane choline transporter
MRESGDNMLACCAEFFLSCLERVIEYFNEWAFCFVGIYGFSFVESGMEVMNLLKSRGWTSIIADDLTGRALLLVSCCVALLNGLVGILIGNMVTMGEGVPLIVPFL